MSTPHSTQTHSLEIQDPELQAALAAITLPKPNSHKGHNGKLLIIGGSELFHAASKWSLDVASKLVDMVFYSSVPSNNATLLEAKGQFWNGIVVPRGEVESYCAEADCILIGPGMERRESRRMTTTNWSKPLTPEDWESDTERLVNFLLSSFPDKKWVIDAGALQMVNPSLLNTHCILTPHYRELTRLFEAVPSGEYAFGKFSPDVSEDDVEKLRANAQAAQEMSEQLSGATLLIKGMVDFVANSRNARAVAGGNPGMTKGGTGDVLAGLVAGLYCTSTAWSAAVVGSFVNKRAGERLGENVGPFFSASDLAIEVPATLWSELSQVQTMAQLRTEEDRA